MIFLWPFMLWLLVLLVFGANYLLVYVLLPNRVDRMEVPYTLFRQQVQAGNVAEITSRGDAIQGTFKQPVTQPAEPLFDSAGTTHEGTRQ